MTRINTNVQSLIANRVLNRNNNSLNTAMERLSTGLRINSGKDDPAGLIASEKMRSEITDIQAAMENAARADQVVNVAEGALNEVNNLLIEMESLVDRSANEAGLSDEEVEANQLQIDSILNSINRIADSTEFNGKKLLNGELDYTTSGVTTGANASSVTNLQINSARVPNDGTRTVTVEVTSSAETGRLEFSGTETGAGVTTLQIGGNYGTEQLSFASNTSADDVVAAVNQSTDLTGVSATNSGGSIYFNSTDYGSDALVSVEAVSGTFAVTGGDGANTDHGVDASVNINGSQAVTDGLDVSLRTSSLDVDMTLSETFGTQTSNTKTFYVTGGGADFNISPTVGISGLASLGISGVSTGSLGKGNIGYLTSLNSGATNDLASGNFETSQRIVREAISQVSTLRGRLGSFQKNTLDSTVNALQIAMENTSAAQSAVRDADFAQETANLTRAQILQQSSLSTLKMANQQPQNVLALLG